MQEKLCAITAAVAAIEKQFGKGAITPLGGVREVSDVPVIPTGSLGLDLALGVGGLPRGRVTEVFGPAGAGKTTLALHAIAEAQKMGGVCAFVDVSHTLDIVYARHLGVEISSLLVSQPDCGEQALEIVDQLARMGAVDLIVVDSADALTPRAEVEGEVGDAHMGLQARLLSSALRKVTAVAAKQNTCVVFVNEVGPRSPTVFGSSASGSTSALKFYSSVRLDVHRLAPLREGEDQVGIRVRVKVVKNKLASPFQEAEFDVRWGAGIDRGGELLDAAVAAGMVTHEGSCYLVEDGWHHFARREDAKRWAAGQAEAIRAAALAVKLMEVS